MSDKVLKELSEVHKKYLCNGPRREANRFVHFSEEILRINPQYYQNIPKVDEFRNQNNIMTSQPSTRRKLKVVDIHKVLKRLAEMGFPEEPSASKRFSECLFIWLAACWDIFGPILMKAKKIVERVGDKIETKILVFFDNKNDRIQSIETKFSHNCSKDVTQGSKMLVDQNDDTKKIGQAFPSIESLIQDYGLKTFNFSDNLLPELSLPYRFPPKYLKA